MMTHEEIEKALLELPLPVWERDRLERPYDTGIGYEAESRIVGGAGLDRHHRRSY